MAKRLQIKQKATETKSHIFVRNHKTEFLEHTLSVSSKTFPHFHRQMHGFFHHSFAKIWISPQFPTLLPIFFEKSFQHPVHNVHIFLFFKHLWKYPFGGAKIHKNADLQPPLTNITWARNRKVLHEWYLCKYSHFEAICLFFLSKDLHFSVFYLYLQK